MHLSNEVLQQRLEEAYPNTFDYSNTIFNRVTDSITVLHKESAIPIIRVYRKLVASKMDIKDFPELKMFFFQQESNKIWNNRYICKEFRAYRYPCVIEDSVTGLTYKVCPVRHLKGILSLEQKIDKELASIFEDLNKSYGDVYDIFFDNDRILFVDKVSKELKEWNIQSYRKDIRPIWEYTAKTFKDFVKRASEKHSNRFSYEEIEDFSISTCNIKVICKDTGKAYIQRATSHLYGRTPKGYLNITSFDQYVEAVKVIHNNRFSYKMLEDSWSKTCLLEITEISTGLKDTQRADVHLRGFVPKLFNEVNLTTLSERFSNFVSKANQVHDFRYEYKGYVNSNTPLEVYCKKHDVTFYQKPSTILLGFSNCARCYRGSSRGERAYLKFISKELQGKVISTYKPDWLSGKHLDIYIPSLQLAIEYNGIAYHHSNPKYKRGYKFETYHLEKYEACKVNGVNLLYIWDVDNHEKWQEELKKLFKTKKYSIVFKNEERCYNKDLTCFGITYLEVYDD